MSADVKILENGVEVPFDVGKVVIEFFDSNIVRITHAPVSSWYIHSFVIVAKPKQVNVSIERVGNVVAISSNEISVYVDTKDYTIEIRFNGFLIKEVSRRAVKQKLYGEEFYTFEQIFEIEPDSVLHGFGQHAGYSAHATFNYRDRTVYLAQRNTDIVVPFVVSSSGYGILWDVYSMGVVESRGNVLRVWFEACDYLSYYVIYGPDLDRVIAGYRWLTGKAVMLPRYAFGYWQSKERYASQEEIVSVAKTFRERGIPIDIIVQDWRYWGDYGWNAFKFDEKYYPDPKKMVEEIHKLNIRIAISIWPIFEKKTEIYREAEEMGCIMEGGAEDFGLINVFKEECREWFWRKINEVFYSIGIDGWWLDASEPEVMPRLIYSTWQKTLDIGNGRKMIKYLNIYPLLETKAVYEGQRKTSNRRVLILTRSGFAGIQRHGVVNWSGDITGDWTTLRTQIWAGLNYSMSGLPYWTTDIGGFFSGNPDTDGYRELFIRWFQWGAFCPIFRVHGTYYPKEPWRFGEETEKILVKFIRLRYRLLPYIYTLAWMVYSQDYTIMRPLVMDFKNDKNVYNIDDQYMFGPFIMVSPITIPSTFDREIYLPYGTWYDFWTGEKLVGGRRARVNAPLNIIPLHVRAGAVLPLAPLTIESSNEYGNEIELRVYRGRDGEFTLYIDDGETYDYEKGLYALIPIKWIEKENKLVISEKRGLFNIGSIKFKVVIVDRGKGVGVEESKPDEEIEYNGKEIELKL
ncbi:glycoside hydrolase family 31 protein [Ignisphaera sp. 4213-co]|uniref:Glycoside hydrolase family 31 protein n=1 Tax=Ignisphaera cupida TaxID=3050454 RepID=A0ABD4Z6N1_9CREN|nr:TIM-barrel domain-containing protein [Ignisphaera sp. 4213-co]MDK6027985.1 glycoside hydrolase family 31 protein [Ignisphaera sp. 4213-co]